MAKKLVVLGLLSLVLLAGVSLVVIDATDEGEFCTAEALLNVNAPPGWELERDHYNDCQWTLFDAGGGRAPAGLYANVPVDPPSPPPISRSTIGYTLIVLAIGGTIAAAVYSQHRNRYP